MNQKPAENYSEKWSFTNSLTEYQSLHETNFHPSAENNFSNVLTKF